MGLVDTGATGVGLDSNGQIVDYGALYGVEANIGAYGSREWRRSRFGLDYQGNYRAYTNNSFLNGSDHFIGMDYTRQVTRKATVQFRGTGGTSSRAVGGVLSNQLLNTGALGIPINDLFDNRSYFADISGSLILQIGARNSVSMGGAGFAVRRQSAILVGLNGTRAFADIARRVSRRTSIGLSYSYFHVDYPRVFGEADSHTAMLQFSRQIGRDWLLSLAGGAFYTDFAGTRTVQLDPVIAELLGQTTGREAFNAINLQSAFMATLARNWRRSALTASYQRGSNPGNGFLLLSRQENLTVSYTYNNGSRLSVGGNGTWWSTTGMGGFAGNFRSYGAGTTLSYRLTEMLFLTSQLDVRQFSSGSSNFNRLGTRVALGLAFSPGELPLSLR
jgi:hypothetical protein